jgi:hypothetical protein
VHDSEGHSALPSSSHEERLEYGQQLLVLQEQLTPDKVAQIRAISSPEEVEQLELVLQDVQKLEEMEARRLRSTEGSSGGSGMQPNSSNPQRTRHCWAASSHAH